MIKNQPGYSRTEWTIRALLLGLFLVVLVLKVYQPLSAKLYYSELYQDLYGRYRRGEFDTLLPVEMKSSVGVTPLAFEMWLKTEYKSRERLTRNATILGSIRANQKLREDNLTDIRTQAEMDLAPSLKDLADAQEAVQTTQDEILGLESQLKDIQKALLTRVEAIAAVDVKINSSRSANGFTTLIDRREAWADELSDLEQRERAAQLDCERAKARLQTQEEQVRRIQAVVDARSSVLSNAQKQVDDSRNQALEDIARRLI